MNQEEACIGGVMVLTGNYPASGIIAQIKSCYDSIIEEPTEALLLEFLNQVQNQRTLVIISENNASFSELEIHSRERLLINRRFRNLDFLFQVANGRISGFQPKLIKQIDHIFAFKPLIETTPLFNSGNGIVIPPQSLRKEGEEVPCFWFNYNKRPGHIRSPFTPWPAEEWSPSNHRLWDETFKKRVWLVLRLHNKNETVLSTLNENCLHNIIRILAMDSGYVRLCN